MPAAFAKKARRAPLEAAQHPRASRKLQLQLLPPLLCHRCCHRCCYRYRCTAAASAAVRSLPPALSALPPSLSSLPPSLSPFPRSAAGDQPHALLLAGQVWGQGGRLAPVHLGGGGRLPRNCACGCATRTPCPSDSASSPAWAGGGNPWGSVGSPNPKAGVRLDSKRGRSVGFCVEKKNNRA